MRAAYFPHDFNARTDPKLQEVIMTHGVAGLGVYWCLVEMMYEQGGTLPLRIIKSIAFNLHTEPSMVESIIKDFDLFVLTEDNFSSKSLTARLNNMADKSEKARASINARWEKERAKKAESQDTNVIQSQCECNTNAIRTNYESDTNVIRTNYECNTNKINKNKIKEKDNNIKQATSRFIAPSIEQIQAYITEKGYIMSAEQFYYFYDSKGWMVGRTKMKNWKSAVSRWAAEDARRNTNHKQKQYAQPNNNTDKRRGFDAPDGAEYTTGMF